MQELPKIPQCRTRKLKHLNAAKVVVIQRVKEKTLSAGGGKGDIRKMSPRGTASTQHPPSKQEPAPKVDGLCPDI